MTVTQIIPNGTRVYLINVDDWLTADHFFHVPASHTNGRIVGYIGDGQYHIITDAGKEWILGEDSFMVEPEGTAIFPDLVSELIFVGSSVLVLLIIIIPFIL